VTISGTNFAAGATVTFGGVAATSVSVTSGAAINATTPAHAAGSVAVVVTNPGGQSGSLASGFTYAGIGFQQVAAATPQGPTQSVQVAFPRAQGSGNLNVVIVGWADTTSSVQSVQDTAGNVYSLALGPTSGVGFRQSIYYAPGTHGGANAITVVFDRAAAFPDIRVLEYSGVATLDKVAGASGNSKTSSSGTVTTTAASELIVGANTVRTATAKAGTGFTSRVITKPDGDIAEDRTVNLVGNYGATATLTSSGPWVMQVVTFK
jgi:hypothetical protein